MASVSDQVRKKSIGKKLNSAILFSGGKDSGLALEYALRYTNVKCLIIIQSKNTESYMFHTPNIRWAEAQAKATGIPYIVQKTEGVKEEELKDLETAIKRARQKYKVQAIVTGAIESVYQASRVQAITNNLRMECFNPLWQRDQVEILEELIQKKFDIILIGIFGYGMDKLIGRRIDKKFVDEMRLLRDRLRINPAGEGGEFESIVLSAPYYKKPLSITKSRIVKDDSGGIVLNIEMIG
jgi:diphthine-ammonia ligase